MKRGIENTQSQLIQLCKDLFYPSGEFKESTDNLVQFLNETPLQELDFNLEILKTSIKEVNLTPLAIVVQAALKGQSDPLEIILTKVSASKLDFNIKSQHGTLLRKIAVQAVNEGNQKVLQLVLDSVDLRELNFNAISDENHNTVLNWIMTMAARGDIKPLKTILKKADLSRLNFNIKSKDGETPLWWLALFLANKQISSKTLERLFANIDISQLDFNAKLNDESISVLSLLTTAAAQGRDKPLHMILKEDLISKFVINEEIGRGILLNLILTAMNGYPELLKNFLSNEQVASRWLFDDSEKAILFQGDKEKIKEILMNITFDRRSILLSSEVLPVCISMGYTSVALACIQKGADQKSLQKALLDAITNGHHETVKEIFFHYKWNGIPILTMQKGKAWTNIDEINTFLMDPHTYLSSCDLYTDKIYDRLQLKLIQHCEDLFSPNELLEQEVSNDLEQFLFSIPLKKLDFNRVIENGPFKGNTLLWVIALAAYKGRFHLLKIILEKLDEDAISKLNFNSSPKDGKYEGRSALWLVAKLAIFSKNSAWENEILDIFSTILNKADISKLDFTAKAKRGSLKNQSVLLLMTKAGVLLSLVFVNALLLKNRLRSVDFNEQTPGAMTPLWWLAHLASENKKSTALQLVLDNIDICAPHLNAKSSSNTTVLYMAIQAAAHGLIGPLQTIINKVEISELDFKSKPDNCASVAFLLVLVALSGSSELLRKILLHKELDLQWVDENAKKILEKSQDEINAFFMNKIKNKINDKNEKVLENLIRFGYTKEALACLEAGADTGDINDALYDANEKGYQETVIQLFPNYELYGIPISKILKNELFNSYYTISYFLMTDEKLSFIRPFCSELTYCALRLLELDKDVTEYENYLLIGNEAVASDHKVVKAKNHFDGKLKPAFEKKLLSYGDTKDNAILAIEKNILLLILDKIVEQAESTLQAIKKQDDKSKASAEAVIDFVKHNREKLLKLDDEVMKDSCKIFNSQNRNHTAQAAWRGFNPHAPVSGKDPNLLTPPISDKKVWTTLIDHPKQERDPNEVYQMLREWKVYYYLAVVDENDGSEAIRQSRKTNYIGQLADIRNAKGPDDPSCFPGTLTRFSDSGAFHKIAQLPQTTKELLIDHFKGQILDLFENKLKNLQTLKEKEALFYALTELTRNKAKYLINNSEDYKEEWIILRENFIEELDGITVNQRIPFPAVFEDYVYIEQILYDIAGHDIIHTALSNCFYKHTDRLPTDEELAKANPFENDTENHKLCQFLLDHIFNFASHYKESIQRLKDLITFFEQKIPIISQNGKFEEFLQVLQGLEIEPEAFIEIKSALQKMSWTYPRPSVIENPFDNKISAVFKIGDNKTMKKLKIKQELFNRYLPYVQKVFQNCKDAKPDFLSRFTEAIVTFVYFHEGWDDKTFEREFYNDQLAELDDEDKSILHNNVSLLPRLMLSNENLDLNKIYTPSFNAVKNSQFEQTNEIAVNHRVIHRATEGIKLFK